jgi:hypothetical protein
MAQHIAHTRKYASGDAEELSGIERVGEKPAGHLEAVRGQPAHERRLLPLQLLLVCGQRRREVDQRGSDQSPGHRAYGQQAQNDHGYRSPRRQAFRLQPRERCRADDRQHDGKQKRNENGLRRPGAGHQDNGCRPVGQ